MLERHPASRRAAAQAAAGIVAWGLGTGGIAPAALAGTTPPAPLAITDSISGSRPSGGALRVLQLPGLESTRPQQLLIWRPAGADTTRPATVLYLFAGAELFDAPPGTGGEEWGLDEFLAAGVAGLPELLVVAIVPGPDALRDLAPPESRPDARGEAYAHYVARCIKPYIDAHWSTRADAASNWVAGEDAGAAFAVYLAWTHPREFGVAIGLGVPAPERELPSWCRQLPAPPGPRLWLDRVTSASASPSTTAWDAALGRGATLQIRQAGPRVPRIVRLAAALRFAALP